MFTALYPHNKNGGVDLKAIAAEAGACKHFCPSKWAKVGGMLQVRLTLCSLPAIHNLRVRQGSCRDGRCGAPAPRAQTRARTVWRLRGCLVRCPAWCTSQGAAAWLTLRAMAPAPPGPPCLAVAQMDGSVKFADSPGGVDTSHYSF